VKLRTGHTIATLHTPLVIYFNDYFNCYFNGHFNGLLLGYSAATSTSTAGDGGYERDKDMGVSDGTAPRLGHQHVVDIIMLPSHCIF
jgi:hypothetical protein